MNTSDSQRLKSILMRMGLAETDEDISADVLIYNTCSVRQAAEDRLYGIHRELSKLKKQHPEKIIAVTGCMIGRDSDGKIRERLSSVDLFFKTEDMIYLPQRITELNHTLIHKESTQSNSEYEHYLKVTPSYHNSFQAYIAISNGCNKFCTYCVVPYARGRQKDRPAGDVIQEAKSCAQRGCLELTILGQTVNLYNPPDKETAFSADNPFSREKNCFGALMWELNHISGIKRIHFTAPHPQYMDDETISTLSLPNHVNFLHLPVQSGSNEVLKRMNRPYTREAYITTIMRVRDVCPNIAIGTDIIVGFCGETESQFEETLDLYRACDFDIAYLGIYSTRSGTVAAKMYKDDIPRQEKKRRWRVLQTLMEKTVMQKNQKYINTTVSVLVDSWKKGKCEGNSREMKRVSFSGTKEMIGSIVNVCVIEPLEWVLKGEYVHSHI
jgi:tRNA-2-methylthio-N6-dimethylallyladenosine synthase